MIIAETQRRAERRGEADRGVRRRPGGLPHMGFVGLEGEGIAESGTEVGEVEAALRGGMGC